MSSNDFLPGHNDPLPKWYLAYFGGDTSPKEEKLPSQEPPLKQSGHLPFGTTRSEVDPATRKEADPQSIAKAITKMLEGEVSPQDLVTLLGIGKSYAAAINAGLEDLRLGTPKNSGSAYNPTYVNSIGKDRAKRQRHKLLSEAVTYANANNCSNHEALDHFGVNELSTEDVAFISHLQKVLSECKKREVTAFRKATLDKIYRKMLNRELNIFGFFYALGITKVDTTDPNWRDAVSRQINQHLNNLYILKKEKVDCPDRWVGLFNFKPMSDFLQSTETRPVSEPAPRPLPRFAAASSSDSDSDSDRNQDWLKVTLEVWPDRISAEATEKLPSSLRSVLKSYEGVALTEATQKKITGHVTDWIRGLMEDSLLAGKLSAEYRKAKPQEIPNPLTVPLPAHWKNHRKFNLSPDFLEKLLKGHYPNQSRISEDASILEMSVDPRTGILTINLADEVR